MPIYEYRCGSCGHKKEYLQKLSDAPIQECPNCGRPEMIKLVSAAGFQLKGSGWYATDFKNSGAGPAKKDDQSGAEKPGAEKPGAEKPDASKSDKTDSSDKSAKSEAGPACGAGACPACQ